MDDQFDRLSRAMAGSLPRRHALKVIAATAAGMGAAMLGLRPLSVHAACSGTCSAPDNGGKVYCTGNGVYGCGGCGAGNCAGKKQGDPCTCS
jgi:hypothetical protein